ncbi:hypothetical protein SELMODRAFT_407977 [Selaginella moellendorffii]|uniref:Uncharacterized protein n=1 Tax=Selaginella moellendorffii TaxID=88036 RepID=D8R6T5_SELML|nr:hypothetical protein SELMODRAFT_407977 [Selaginella moellendorffii]
MALEVAEVGFGAAREVLGRLYVDDSSGDSSGDSSDNSSVSLSSVNTIATVVMVWKSHGIVSLAPLKNYDLGGLDWLVLFPTRGEKRAASFMAVDHERDIAMLKIEGGALPFLRSSKERLSLGRQLHFLGYVEDVDKASYKKGDGKDETNQIPSFQDQVTVATTLPGGFYAGAYASDDRGGAIFSIAPLELVGIHVKRLGMFSKFIPARDALTKKETATAKEEAVAAPVVAEELAAAAAEETTREEAEELAAVVEELAAGTVEEEEALAPAVVELVAEELAAAEEALALAVVELVAMAEELAAAAVEEATKVAPAVAPAVAAAKATKSKAKLSKSCVKESKLCLFLLQTCQNTKLDFLQLTLHRCDADGDTQAESRPQLET